MKKTAVIVMLLFSTVLFSAPKNGDDDKKAKTSELPEQLLSIVQTLLEGENIEGVKKNISPEAYVINNSSYESIWEVLGEPSKKENFIDGKDVKLLSIQMRIPDDEKSAYMILRTQPKGSDKVNWNTIYFVVGKNQQWQILSWHKS